MKQTLVLLIEIRTKTISFGRFLRKKFVQEIAKVEESYDCNLETLGEKTINQSKKDSISQMEI